MSRYSTNSDYGIGVNEYSYRDPKLEFNMYSTLAGIVIAFRASPEDGANMHCPLGYIKSEKYKYTKRKVCAPLAMLTSKKC
jgi:hypothetical protein